MKNSGKTRIMVPGRSEGDGMEQVPEPESTKPFLKHLVGSHGKKEPKFVPYEPYKAAVCALLPQTPEQKAVTLDTQRVTALAQRLCVEGGQVKELQDKVKALEQENKELRSQYHVQAEVNADLKKLLVASLGEDVQLKVQFMTEDKAQLGKELLRLSHELQEQREEADKLSIRCDVWESKFKASSLMVKDLAHWKASLSCRLRESLRGIDSLLQEHDLLFEELCAIHRTLEGTLLDTRASSEPSSVRSMHLSQLTSEVGVLCRKIQECHLGRLQCSSLSETPFRYIRLHTRAENLAHQTLKSLEQKGIVQTTGSVPSHKCHAISFCKHCCGEVKLI